MPDKAWKAALLKSSLPLEHDVAQTCAGRGWLPHGPFPYLRQNETGRLTEFSIDLLATNQLNASDGAPLIEIAALIECKYCSPDISWVFAPLVDPGMAFGHALSAWQAACTQQIDPTAIMRFDESYTLCGRGIALQANDAKENSIAHGLYQLRYAVPQCVAKHVATQHAMREDIGIVQVILPVLVTTAPLWVLQTGVTQRDFERADSVADVATSASGVAVYREAGEDLVGYANRVAGRLLHNQRWAMRLDAVYELSRRAGKLTVFGSARSHLGTRLAMAAERAIIVTRDALPEMLDRVFAVCAEAASTRRLLGTFCENVNDGGPLTCRVASATGV